jgi:bacteriocin biosynthesis cyclodehydratase domain-containing protein
MKRPRFKPSRRPRRLGSGQVQFLAAVPGLAFDVVDPDGWLWRLCRLLDGTRTVERVVAVMRRRYPRRPDDHVRRAVGDLFLAGFLEDAGELEPVELTGAERERYSRSRELFQRMDDVPRTTGWAAQLALKRAKVAVLGLGGVGGFVTLALTVSGVGHVHCVDRDVVSRSDLNRQILYFEQDLDQPKVDVAVRRLRERNSEVLVTGERRDIDGPDAVVPIATDFDVVVLAADSPPEIASWANRACWTAGTPWVLGGYDGALMTAGVYRPGAGPCYDCARTAERERVAGRPPWTEWLPGADGIPPHAANVVTVSLAGSLAANAVLSVITGVPELPVNRLYQLNLSGREFSTIGPNTPHPDCPTCGSRKGS